MHRDNEGRSRGFGWLRFANPVPNLTSRGPFKLRDFELTVEVSNSKMANDAGGAVRANNNNNNSRQHQQQRNRRQDDHHRMNDRHAHPMMRPNNRTSHVMPSGQTSMRQGNALHPHMDRSVNSGQALQTPSTTTQTHASSPSSSLLQPLSVATPLTATNHTNNTSPLHKCEEA